MKERPILFSAPMVRSLLTGDKTQTRRMMKLKNGMYVPPSRSADGPGWEQMMRSCPYGKPGDRLWVRESFCPIYPQNPHYNGGRPIEYDYAATYEYGHRLGDLIGVKKKWKPSIHMPREASRITLEITAVRVEHLHDISDADSIAEGAVGHPDGPWHAYRSLWSLINGTDSWDANPLVWVVEFKRVAQESGAA